MKYQKIRLKYKGKEIIADAKVLESVWQQGLGKMFSLSKKPILFVFPEEQEVQIHMLFVFMPLLVFWLDKNKEVVQVKKMKPFASFESARAKYILEIPLKNLN